MKHFMYLYEHLSFVHILETAFYTSFIPSVIVTFLCYQIIQNSYKLSIYFILMYTKLCEMTFNF